MMRRLPATAVYTKVDSPVGGLHLVAADEGLLALLWDSYVEEAECRSIIDGLLAPEVHPILDQARRELGEYFLGKRDHFELPVSLDGTAFQCRAWAALREIPYGQTISYGEQATMLGNANKARAVGAANARNPISIVVPCHRVIAGDGNLRGFGGGIDQKAFLLALENGR